LASHGVVRLVGEFAAVDSISRRSKSADPFASSTVAGAIKSRNPSVNHLSKDRVGDRLRQTIGLPAQHAKLERWI
jgi:hypothetical protein